MAHILGISKRRATTQEYLFSYAYPLVCKKIILRRKNMTTEMQYTDPNDLRLHHGFGGFGHGGFGHFGGFGHGGFGHFGRPFGFGGFGRPFGFGFGRPFGFGFGLPFLGGLAAGALLSPYGYGYGYGYPYYGYGYPYYY
jgi:hypothetical protein